MNTRPTYLPLTATLLCAPALAQTASPTPAPEKKPAPAASSPFANVAGFTITGYLRTRVENYDFFEAANGDSKYTFTGSQLRLSGIKSSPTSDIQIDLQQELLTNVPDDAFFRPAPGTAVPLGQGGNYRAANGSQDGELNIKQAFIRYKNLDKKGDYLRVGRFEFNDGTETVSKDPTLNFLKTQRISQRLIGTFGFSHVGRAFDGAQFSTPLNGGNLTLVGARPTEGVFQVNANDNIDGVDFAYGAYTHAMKAGDARLFGMLYEDKRDPSQSVKTDNRALALRQVDDGEIHVYTVGANLLHTFDTGAGKLDFLAWGAYQGGNWGKLDQSANAFTFEGGYQPKNIDWKPWLRFGYYRSSGDGDPTDGKHKTFFTPLPTPRVYARFPFYNQMNLKDTFGQLMLRPNIKTNVRLEAHALSLDNANDLYYSGGGAYQDSGFGIAGRPSGGKSKLANVFDISTDYALNAKTSITLYLAHASGGGAIATTYTKGDNANFAYVELNRKF